MLKPSKQNLQMNSLRQTKNTKKQVLESVESSSIEDLMAIVPEIPENATMDSIVSNVDRMLNSPSPPDLSDIVTEAIILAIGRPVFFILNNEPVLSGPEVTKFKDLITNASHKFHLHNKISSVGRIETDNLPGYEWVGTGWLFEEDLLLTNRHVANLFVESTRSRLSFKRFIGKTVIPRIDFLAEHNNNQAAEFSIIECLYVASQKEHDVAIFRIKSDNVSSHLPLNILNGDAQVREDVTIIGYPAFDSRVSKVEDMERIYQKIYNIKRFAPGKITHMYTSEGIAIHDASTLGGNSGSLVFSLETGNAIGLHFAGKEGEGNFFVTSTALRKIINRLPKRNFYTNGNSSPSSQPVSDNLLSELVPRNCTLEEYTPIQVPDYSISGRIRSYASPDSTFAITQKMFEQASESILIGIYDFSAEHMLVSVKDAIDRGVKLALMLDIDSDKENEVFKKLKRYGVECVPAPSCASKNISYFSSSHEKVIVIDNEWTLIQSGNYSNNSIPFNEGDGVANGRFKPGNRDMGIAIESKPLAKFFTRILRADMQLEKSASGEESIVAAFPSAEFLTEAPTRRPSILFPSKEFNDAHSVKVQPVLSPDNYMDEIPKLLKSAKQSIKIEQQYIRVGQKNITKLIDSILEAKANADDGFSVKIIVASPIGDKPEKTFAEVNALKELGFEVCLLSKKHFVHCHNKLIIIDDKVVLISSQNWSDSAVSKNREAGIIVYDKEITEYYSKIFDADWTMSDESIEEYLSVDTNTNLEAYSSEPGKYVVIDACDVQEV